MKFISWNTNGIRAALKKGFLDFFKEIDADIFSIQETKMQDGQAEIITPNHKQYISSAERKGYSGTLCFTKEEPINVTYGINNAEFDNEGRVITLEFDKFYFVNVYTPNSGDGLKRLDYRMNWDDLFKEYVVGLKKKKPVIICGDLNVAHQEIDLKNPSSNRRNAGFTDEERSGFSKLLEAGFIDTYRYLYPDKIEYSWWSYRMRARERNAGWRIDYFLVSDDLKDKIKEAKIYTEVMGSDHCPVMLEIEV